VDLLVIGGSGFLGLRVTRQARLAGHRVTATFHASVPPAVDADWRMLDIRRRDDVAALTRQVRPDVVINAAYQYSDWETTADGAAHVALAAAAAGAQLVHVSSDAVFSGTALSYDETCQPDPVNSYGAAKAAAETAVKGIMPGAAIARTSLIIGDGDSPHERLVHALASGTASGVLFTDDVRCAVHVTDLASALLELAAGPPAGVCHVAGTDAVSRYELGVLIARRDGLDPAALPAGLRAATGFPGPFDLRLDSTKTQARLTTRLRGARDFLTPPAARGRRKEKSSPPRLGPLAGLDGSGGRECFPDALDNRERVLEEFAPGEVDDLEAVVTESLVAFNLPDGASRVGVLDLAVRFGDNSVLRPVEVHAVAEVWPGDRELEFRRIKAVLMKGHAGT
jgi:dTDP-4-dehydrorhamnose reductase